MLAIPSAELFIIQLIIKTIAGLWQQVSFNTYKHASAPTREELPIRESPEIDYTKPPATLRFKEGYNGQTPHRSGIDALTQ
eukprot:1041894-Pyramimonas_sp.AAC.1